MANDIIELIGEESLDEASALVEAGIDSLMKEGVFKELPVASTILGIMKTISNVRDALFVKRVAKFLLHLEKVPESERRAFIDKLAKTPNEKMKIGERTLLILERMDDIDKAEVIANIFVAYIKGNIDFHTFTKLASAINNVNTSDLRAIANANKSYDAALNERLVSVGLMLPVGLGSTYRESNTLGRSSFFNYDLSTEGELIKKYAFD